MAEASKSQLRNKKRRNRKKVGKQEGGSGEVEVEVEVEVESETQVTVVPEPQRALNPIAEVKRQLEEAKAAKDHTLAQELRQQLWVLQDTAATGTAGPGAPVLDTSLFQSPKSTHSEDAVSSPDPTEKKILKLRKKLEKIESLRQRQASGEKLEANQLAKIQTASGIQEEIEILESLLTQSQLR